MQMRTRIAALLVLPLVVLGACGSDDDNEPASSASVDGGGWSFTDDRGVEITLPERPERIVAYHNAAAALIPLDIVPVGVFGGAAPEDSPLLTGLDLDGIESVGNVYGELNFEALAGLEPDLIVTMFDPAQTGPIFGFLENAQDLAEDIAPVLALNGAADPAAGIERFEELATALGADIDTNEIAEERTAFEDAVEALGAAAEANPGVRALALQAYPGDGIYFGRPDAFPSLRLFREAGLDLVEPEGDPGDVNENFVNFFWEFSSFELGGTYPADLVLLGNNEGAMDEEQIRGVTTMASHPAVEADQIVGWQVLDRYNYRSFTQQLEDLAAAVESADPDLESAVDR